jgi:hypothetical protein
MKISVGHIKGFNNLDYISCWFYKASVYIMGINSQFAFVSTNSICQGSQVALLWSQILKHNLEISFAYQSFKWTNNAKRNAGVTCIIVGVRNENTKEKYIFKDKLAQRVDFVNAYLVNSKNIIVEGRRNTLSKLPPINYGSFALDGGNYTLNPNEAKKIIDNNFEANQFIIPFLGARELISSQKRYCIWIKDAEYPWFRSGNNIDLI